jgi:hypothetical protein
VRRISNYDEHCGHGGVPELTVCQSVSEEPELHELVDISSGALDILRIEFGVDGQLVPVNPVHVGVEGLGVDVLEFDDATGGFFPASATGSFEVLGLFDEQALGHGEGGGELWMAFIDDDGDVLGQVWYAVPKSQFAVFHPAMLRNSNLLRGAMVGCVLKRWLRGEAVLGGAMALSVAHCRFECTAADGTSALDDARSQCVDVSGKRWKKFKWRVRSELSGMSRSWCAQMKQKWEERPDVGNNESTCIMPRALTPGDFSGCGLIYTSQLSAHIGGSRTVGLMVCH